MGQDHDRAAPGTRNFMFNRPVRDSYPRRNWKEARTRAVVLSVRRSYGTLEGQPGAIVIKLRGNLQPKELRALSYCGLIETKQQVAGGGAIAVSIKIAVWREQMGIKEFRAPFEVAYYAVVISPGQLAFPAMN
jgi:hypothetical protein